MAGNRDAFIDIWGPRIFRDALLDAIDGGDRFSSDPLHVAIVIAGNDRLRGLAGSDREDLGDGPRSQRLARQLPWPAPRTAGTPRDPSVEAVIVLDPSCDVRLLPRKLVTMAWIGDEPDDWLDRAWFDEFDLVFASTDRVVEMVRERSAKVASLVPIARDDAQPASAAAGRSERGGRSATRSSAGPPRRDMGSGSACRAGTTSSAGATTTSRAGCSARSSGPATRPGSTSCRTGARSPTRATTSPSTCSGSRRPRPGAARSTSCGRSATRPGQPGRSTSATTTCSWRRTVRRADGRAGGRAGQPAPPGDRSGALPAGAGRAAPRAAVRGQLAQGPPADRGRPGGHDPRPRDLRPQLDAGPRRPALRQGRGRPERRARALLQRRRRSCSTTTGTTCASRASSRTGCTTRWRAGRSSSPTQSTASRPSSTTPSPPTITEPSSSGSSSASSPTRTSAADGGARPGRGPRPAHLRRADARGVRGGRPTRRDPADQHRRRRGRVRAGRRECRPPTLDASGPRRRRRCRLGGLSREGSVRSRRTGTEDVTSSPRARRSYGAAMF